MSEDGLSGIAGAAEDVEDGVAVAVVEAGAAARLVTSDCEWMAELRTC